MKKFSLLKIMPLVFLVLSLFFLVIFGKKIQNYFGKAEGLPAKIIVETQSDLGVLPQPWQALAQGGEEKEQRLANVVPLIQPLTPKYLRIDHLFDAYGVVNGAKNGQMTYDFSKLDQLVNDILATGAKPMLSLSYMPPVISQRDVTDLPSHWSDWQEIVKTIIEHYSGKNHQNIDNVYYEVWNEPDLFGQWKTYGKKNYLQLYEYAAKGAAAAQAVNNFKIGGPATTAFYKNWIEELVKYVYKNHLRLDFLSWHKYSLQPQAFLDDINFVDTLLTSHYGGFYLLPKFISEWGSDPQNSPLHDAEFDAAHMVAVIRQLLSRVDLAFVFEIKDGPDPSGKDFWGRWGLLTHEKAGLVKKPKYYALELLNQMKGQRLNLTGEGTFVTGFGAKTENSYKIILTNYDQEGKHSETFPVTFVGLTPGEYQFSQTNLYGKIVSTNETVTNNSLLKTIFLPANNLVLLELNFLFP